MSTAGALHHGLVTLGWDAAVCGPGPGIVGSGTPLGHGGMEALDSAHVALALGCPTLLVARISSGDGRLRHRGISHHTLTVLDLLLEPVTVALPAGMRSPVGVELRAGLGAVFGAGAGASGAGGSHAQARPRAALAVELGVERPARITRHDWRRAKIDLPGYAASGAAAADDGARRSPPTRSSSRPRSPAAARSRSSRSKARTPSKRERRRRSCDGPPAAAAELAPSTLVSEERLQALGGETLSRGRIVEIRKERFRHEDGGEVEREIVRHEGAVGVVAHDEEVVWLVRQPREAVMEPALLEIPAGRLDKQGEQPLAAAQRELAEEIGRAARSWEPILSYYSSAGFTDERVHLYAATDLYEHSADSGENERIEVVRWPLGGLERAIQECEDAKTLIGLLWLARRLGS